jgi:hypothetical protein
MAVNENLYNWMFKTYGMQPAEWYRNNPGKPPASNPFLPKGSYVPKAQKQPTGPRGELLASVSPDIIEASIIEPGPRAAVETEDQKFERFYNESKQQLNIGQAVAPGEYAAAGGLYYYPEFGEYGGYLTKNNPDQAQVARVRDMMARQARGEADPSWANQDLSNLISVQGQGGWHVRGATESDPEVQKFGIYNVGRSDYRQSRQNQAIQKNIEILLQQAESGIQSSQDALKEVAPQQANPARGPRGEDMGEIAWNTPAIPQGPYTPVRNFGSKDKPFYGPSTKDTHNNPSGERVMPIRYEAQAPENRPEFDEQKALIARQAADEYRRRGQVEDPFRSGAFG